MLIIDDFRTVDHRHDVDLDAAMIAVVVDHPVDLLLDEVDRSDSASRAAEPRHQDAGPSGPGHLATGDETPVVS